MLRTQISIIAFLLIAGFCLGQSNVVLLNPQQLKREKDYLSMEEALKEPLKVYKLNLKGQKLKEIPAEISQLKNLQVLNLSENRLKVVGAEIGILKNLQFLSLYGNSLRTLPNEMRNLSHLETLYLGKNKISTMPVWVGGLGRLKRLDITLNRITPREADMIKYKLPKCEITN